MSLQQRLSRHERVLCVIADHPAPEHESMLQLAGPALSPSLGRQTLRRQAQRVAHRTTEKETGQTFLPTNACTGGLNSAPLLEMFRNQVFHGYSQKLNPRLRSCWYRRSSKR